MKIDARPRPEQIHASSYLAPTAIVLGDVTIAAEASVWFGAIIRGDTERIAIGRGTNVQDLCVVHADAGLPCIIGERVTLGHGAIVHGAIVDDDVMIGIRATVLNGAQIGSGSIIAAGRRRARRDDRAAELARDGRAGKDQRRNDGSPPRPHSPRRRTLCSRGEGV